MTYARRISPWWWFLVAHAIWWASWFVLEVEPFPYGFLTMVLSLEAIVLSTLILIVANQQAARDRAQAADDRKQAAHIERIAEHLDRVHDHQLKILQHVERMVNANAKAS